MIDSTQDLHLSFVLHIFYVLCFVKISSLFIIVTVQSQESERYVFVQILSFTVIFLWCFVNVPTVCYFLPLYYFLILYHYFFFRFQAISFTLIRTFVFLCQIYSQHNKISTQNHGRKFALTRYSFLLIMKNKYYLIPHCGSVTVPKTSRKII